MTIAHSICGGFLAGKSIYYLIDQGLANILAVQTLQHGTNLINYISIRILGADPQHAGKISGATFGKPYKVEGYFYVIKDSEFSHLANRRHLAKVAPKLFDDQPIYYENHKLELAIESLRKRLEIPFTFTYLSTYNLVFHTLGIKIDLIARIAGHLNCIFVPIAKFRYASIDKALFEEDEMYVGYAYKTKHKLPPWRMGIMGSLLTGINHEWPSRIYSYPSKLITGLIQLTTAVFLLYLSSFIKNPRFKASLFVGVLLG